MFIDLVAVLLLMYGLYIGYTRGIIKTVFSVISILVGVLAALKLSPLVINFLESSLNIHPGINFLLGFGLTFLIIMIAVRFIGKKLEDILQMARINVINKTAGAIVMGALFMIAFSYSIYGINRLELISDTAKQKSITYSFLRTVPNNTEQALLKLKPLFTGFYKTLDNTFEKIKELNAEKEQS